jgi:1,4-dihydroxy-2-naphthoyl-CoA hydrolase
MTFSVKNLNEMCQNTLVSHLQIEFLQFENKKLVAKMPVNNKTKQPYGILHGGASAALAETVGSVAGNLHIQNEHEFCVGIHLSINHIRSVNEGYVFAEATPIQIGKKIQVWNIDIKNESSELVASSRLTLLAIQKEK